MMFSIVIPTRDRPDTLYWTLKSCTACNYLSVEFIVVDNCSDYRTYSVVKSFLSDSRFRYVKTKSRLSMADNWSYGLKIANGEIISVLGDDDALLSHTLSTVASLFSVFQVDAIRSRAVAYKWPSLSLKNVSSTYLLPKFNYSSSIKNTSASLRLCMSGLKYYTYLPVIYNGGFVRRSILQHILQYNSGILIPCRNPDVYIGVAISLTLEKYLFTDIPLVINGASHHSNGTANHTRAANPIIQRMYEAKDGPSQIFLSEQNRPFDSSLLQDELNPVFNIQIALFDAFLKCNLFPQFAAYSSFYDIQHLIRSCMIVHGKSKVRTISWINEMIDYHHLPHISTFKPSPSVKLLQLYSKLASLPYKLSSMLYPNFANVFEASSFISHKLSKSSLLSSK